MNVLDGIFVNKIACKWTFEKCICFV